MSHVGRELEVVVLGPAAVELRGDGPLDEAATFHREVGGEGSLAAVVAARAGATTALSTHVGDDPFGRWLIQRWEHEGLHLDFTREVSRPSALEVVGADLHRFAPLPLSQTAAATLTPAEVASIPWELARVLVVTGAAQAAGPEALAAVTRAASQAHAAGVRVLYDPALSPSLWAHAGDRAPRRALEALIPALDTLVVGAPYGAGRLLGQPAPADAVQAALALGIPHVIVRESPDRKPPSVTAGHGDGAGAPEAACSVSQGPPGSSPQRVSVRASAEPAPADRRRAIFDGVLATALANEATLPRATQAALEATALPRDEGGLPSAVALRPLLAALGSRPADRPAEAADQPSVR